MWRVLGVQDGQILINLVAGAVGGIGAGKSSTTFDLGTIGNIVAGAVGGGVLGQIVQLLLPSIMAAAQSGNLSVGGIVSQAIAGGAGGGQPTPGPCGVEKKNPPGPAPKPQKFLRI